MKPGRFATADRETLKTNDIESIRNQFFNITAWVATILGLPLLLISLQIERIGYWEYENGLHILMYLGCVFCTVSYKRVSFNFRVCLLLVMICVIGIFNLLRLGHMGMGIPFLVMFSLLTVIFFGIRAGIAACLFSILMMTCVGIAATTGTITYQYNYEAFAVSPHNWTVAVFGRGLSMIILVGCIGLIHRSMAVSIEALKIHGAELEKEIQDRHKAEKALKSNEQLFRQLVENVHTGICIIKKHRIVYSNPAQTRIFEISPPVDHLQDYQIHPDDEQKVLKEYFAVLAGEKERVDIEFRFKLANRAAMQENYKYVHCSGGLVMFEDDVVLLVAMTDLTMTRNLQKRVQIREKMASLGHVAAGIAHEIRNPLSGINVLLSGILEEFENPERAEEIHQLIFEAQKASNKIDVVIKRVLDFSRPGKLIMKKININQPVTDAVTLSRTTLKKASIEIKARIDQQIPSVHADKQLLEQVVLNMISNAEKAISRTPRPDAGKMIQISTSCDDAAIIICVADSGPGIPAAIQEQIFDPFYTTSPDGSGIGLSICQRVVTDHGGTIDILVSELGGAEFRIRIPLEKRTEIR